nr:hypothetical protein [Tanacetum cinerariifolium]
GLAGYLVAGGIELKLFKRAGFEADQQQRIAPAGHGGVVVVSEAGHGQRGRVGGQWLAHVVGGAESLLGGQVAKALHGGPAIVAARLQEVEFIIVVGTVLRAV